MAGNVAALGFFLCGKCGIPFNANGLGTHARSCSGTRPSRPLELAASRSREEGNENVEETPSTAGLATSMHRTGLGSNASDPERENPSPGFLAPHIAASTRSNMLSPATIPRYTTPGSATAQAINALMLHSSEGEEN